MADALQLSGDGASAAFDYAQMNAAAASEAQAAVARYRGRSRAYVMDTGRDLIAVKERLDHGLFLRWVEAEMGMTPRTAQNFMQAASQLGHKSEIVSHLPPTILYKLSAPSTPPALREEIVGRLEAGEALKPEDILSEVREKREAARRQATVEREAVRRARLSDVQRAEEDALRAKGERGRAARDRKAERERQEIIARRRHEEAEAAEGAAFLVDHMGADAVAVLFERFDSMMLSRVLSRAQDLAHERRARSSQVVEISVGEFTEAHRYGLGHMSPEEQDEIEALAERFGEGEPITPITAVALADTRFSRYKIAEGLDRYRAVKDILHWDVIPARVVPPLAEEDMARLRGDDE